MKKIIILFIIFFPFISFTQENSNDKKTEIKKEKNAFWKKVNFGGGFGLNFGNNYTSLAITPTAIYNFNEKIALGTGIGYRYSKINNIKNNVYSISALALYNPFPQFQLSSEFEHLFVNQKYNEFSGSYNYPSLHLGAGYRIGRFSSVGISYDILYDKDKSIYSSPISPIFRIFF